MARVPSAIVYRGQRSTCQRVVRPQWRPQPALSWFSRGLGPTGHGSL